MSPSASTALPSVPREGVHPLGWGVGVLHRPGAHTLTEMSLMRWDGPQSILQPHSPSAAEVPAHALATEVGETLAGGCNSADRAFPFGPRGRGSGQRAQTSPPDPTTLKGASERDQPGRRWARAAPYQNPTEPGSPSSAAPAPSRSRPYRGAAPPSAQTRRPSAGAARRRSSRSSAGGRHSSGHASPARWVRWPPGTRRTSPRRAWGSKRRSRWDARQHCGCTRRVVWRWGQGMGHPWRADGHRHRIAASPRWCFDCVEGLGARVLAPCSDTARAASLPSANGGCCLWVNFGIFG